MRRREVVGISGEHAFVKGCLIAAAVVLVIAVVGGIWAWKAFQTFTVTAAKQIMSQRIAQSGIPDDQKLAVTAIIDRLEAEHRAGQITFQQYVIGVGVIGAGRFVTLSELDRAESGHLQASGLSAAEKQSVARAFDRFARGVAEESIDEGTLEQVVGLIATRADDGSWTPRSSLPDDELRILAAIMRGHADGALVSDETYAVNYPDAIERDARKMMQLP
jgi:hypothetical protein